MTNTITVGASGSVMVSPDIAYLNVAVETRGDTAAAAQEANARKFAAVEQVLFQQFRVDAKDVQTTGFLVQPEYEFDGNGGRRLIGYTATHAIRIGYRELAGIGRLLDALTAAGVNRVDSVQFGTEKTAEYEREALRKAMSAAEEKANVLAASAGRQVRGVASIVHGIEREPQPLLFGGQVTPVLMADSAVTTVQTGQIEITATVTVQYFM